MLDLHSLPTLRDSMSFYYAEYCRVTRYRSAVQCLSKGGSVTVPIAMLAVLMLGPGTSITHEAVQLCSEVGCSIIWVGEDAIRYYALGNGKTRKGYRLLQQARLVADPDARRRVARAMYAKRFNEVVDDTATIEELRGREGVRMRNAYKMLARQYGVRWQSRRYKRDDWNASDPINKALSATNALLNGICHSAIVAGGYSPGLGFIHTGRIQSFVYDIADLYKVELSIPVAFKTASFGFANLESRVRIRFRERVQEIKLMQRIVRDIDELLGIHKDDPIHKDFDQTMPGPLLGDEDDEAEKDMDNGGDDFA